MPNRSLVAIEDYSKEKILYMLAMAGEFEKKPNRKLLDSKIVATLFFEPSTRTRLSFETAANRLGAKVIGFADPGVTSSTKGETLKDTIIMVSNYADVIVMRHYLEGAALYASQVSPVPVVNAGDGANQHPSQTMLDLYSIYKTQGRLDNLNICLVGDLKYGRTVHSLLMAMRHFNPAFHFIAPKELSMPDEYKLYCQTNGISYTEHTDFNCDVIADADILYMTRVQRERFTDLAEYEKVKDVYILTEPMLCKTKDNLRILHPLPRVNEIDRELDENPKAYYFQQAKNGLYARQAIICDVLGITLEEVINDELYTAAASSNAHAVTIKDDEIIGEKTTCLHSKEAGIAKCGNPKCITNNEPMKPRFALADAQKGTCKCIYCGKEQYNNKLETQ